MELDDDSWHVVKNTPGVTGFVGAQKPVALSKGEVDRILHVATLEHKPRPTAEFSLGETVKVVSGPLADFDGEIIEVNAEAGRLKVAVSIFERSVPVDLTFDQVKRLD
jgi:transcriptional antiterminator NusG